MKGSMQVRKLRKNAPYYSAKDYDERFGGNFTLFIVPFVDCNGGKFYYTRKLDDGKIQIEGEGYIISDTDSLKRHIKEAKKDLKGYVLTYRWIDEDGYIEDVTEC